MESPVQVMFIWEQRKGSIFPGRGIPHVAGTQVLTSPGNSPSPLKLTGKPAGRRSPSSGQCAHLRGCLRPGRVSTLHLCPSAPIRKGRCPGVSLQRSQLPESPRRSSCPKSLRGWGKGVYPLLSSDSLLLIQRLSIPATEERNLSQLSG